MSTMSRKSSLLQKTILAAVAAAALGTTTLAPTSASAAPWGKKHGWHGHHHHHGGWHRGPGFGFYAPTYAAYDGCVMKKRWVGTPYGKRLRWVRICY